jgi:hypothetical protein
MNTLSIGQVARRAGVGVETVRFYEREGLLEEPSRRASGYRQYSEEVVTRLRIITLPLLLSLLAGTALSGFLSRHTGLVYTGATIYFVVALGYWFLFGPARGKREMDVACPTCAPAASDEQVQERSPMPEDLPASRR